MSRALLLIIFVTILINVAFITLMERKILGLSQYRKGPNKVTLLGFLQPIADAIKLFIKEIVFPFKSNKTLYAFSPVAALALALGLWVTISHSENLFRI
jgi:NADH:ubiquinone oxidoreductase subunit H